MRPLGLHLSPLVAASAERPSALAELTPDGRLIALTVLATDAEVTAAVANDALVAVDAPLEVPNDAGSRDVERVLAWCDVPLLPVAGRRLDNVFGGRRGVGLEPLLRARAARVVETAPELVMRELAWEREHQPGSPPLDLAEYRARWLGIRPPAYRPKGAGRARPAGLRPAAELLSSALDLDGWKPQPEPSDMQAIADAARIDAIAAAYAALVGLTRPDRSVLLGAPGRGQLLFPVDENLSGRLDVNVARMRGDGDIAPDFALRTL